MSTHENVALRATERAKVVARRALDGEYDLLLACRDLASLTHDLSNVPRDIADTFAGVASEVDDLPIGAERRNWSLDALKANDTEATKYREVVRAVVTDALQQLLRVLDTGAE